MRGKGLKVCEHRLSDRITPAYAGKSHIAPHFHKLTVGSPPPMRGKVVDGDEITISTGITPAYAGKRQI